MAHRPTGNAPDEAPVLDLPFDSAITSGKSSRGLYRMSTANYLRNFSSAQGGSASPVGAMPADPRSISFRNALAAAQNRQQQSQPQPMPQQAAQASAPIRPHMASRNGPSTPSSSSPASGSEHDANLSPRKRSHRKQPVKTSSTYTPPPGSPATTLSIPPKDKEKEKDKDRKEKVKSPREERKAQRAYAKAASSYVPSSAPPSSASLPASAPVAAKGTAKAASTANAASAAPAASPSFSAISALSSSKPATSSPSASIVSSPANSSAAPSTDAPALSSVVAPVSLKPADSVAVSATSPPAPASPTHPPETPIAASSSPAVSAASSASSLPVQPAVAPTAPIALPVPAPAATAEAVSAAVPVASSAPAALSSPRSPRTAELQWTASSPRMQLVSSSTDKEAASSAGTIMLASPRQQRSTTSSAVQTSSVSREIPSSATSPPSAEPTVNRGVAFSLPPRLQPTTELSPSAPTAAPTSDNSAIRKSMIRSVLRPCKIQILDTSEVLLPKKKKTVTAYTIDVYYAADAKETIRCSYADALEFRQKLKTLLPKGSVPKLEKEKGFSMSSTTKLKGKQKADLEAFFTSVIQLDSIWREESVRDFFDPERHDTLTASPVTAAAPQSPSSPLSSSAGNERTSSPSPAIPSTMSGPVASSPPETPSDSGVGTPSLGKTKKSQSGRSLMSKLLGSSAGSDKSSPSSASGSWLAGTSSSPQLTSLSSSVDDQPEEKKEDKDKKEEKKEKKEKKDKKDKKEKLTSVEQQQQNSNARMAHPPRERKKLPQHHPTAGLNMTPSPAQPLERIPIRLEVLQIVLQCLEQNHLSLEGIFRVSGDRETVRKIWRSFGGSTAELQLATAGSGYEVAGALKLYFIQAPEPIIPASIYEPVVAKPSETSSLTTSSSEAAQSTTYDLLTLRSLVQNLNPNSRAVLSAVVEFLGKVSTYAERNRMTATNLGIVFASNLMWNSDVTVIPDPGCVARQGVLVEQLILNYSDVFL